ncbi:MAG: hypothetical protein Q8L93_05180 [Rhodocyclaceae bacterium]|nr:hypothetical protein [Rhodocyclaceae bacterium]
MNGKLLLTTLAGASVLLGACTTYPVQDSYYDQPVVVRVAPPPPQYEYYGAPPVVGYVWITGYWNWGGVRHVWVPGRWEAPRHGYYWAPHHWERHGDHWRQQGGRWEQQGGRWEQDQRMRQEPRPAPPAVRPPAQGYPQGQIIQRNEPAPTFQPPPNRAPLPERNIAPGYERESRRPAQEGIEMRPERRSEPRIERRDETRIERRDESRIEREARPAPEHGGSPRAERDERPRQKQDGSGPRRRGPPGSDEDEKR